MPTRGSRRRAASRSRGAASLVAGAVALLATGCGRFPFSPSETTFPVTPGPAQMGPDVSGPRLRYVALGDSYTIGTSVTERERFPNQLVARLPQLELVANLGVNGFTSRDLIEVELPKLPALRPDVVTVLIGVNDVVQGVPSFAYRDNVTVILRELERLVGNGRILIVTIPDYTVTPQGASFGDPTQQSQGIRENNSLMTQLAAGIPVVDIYPISLGAESDRSLVAQDGLHPSGAQYALWVEQIVPAMETLLAR
jgi:acyl-CoA thioesterase I